LRAIPKKSGFVGLRLCFEGLRRPTESGYHSAVPDEDSNATSLQARMDELEIRFSFTGRTVEDLDEVVRDFSARVQRLEREMKELRAMLESLGTPPAPRANA
jgi:uncharacterized coiled-coil protein SlyX